MHLEIICHNYNNYDVPVPHVTLQIPSFVFQMKGSQVCWLHGLGATVGLLDDSQCVLSSSLPVEGSLHTTEPVCTPVIKCVSQDQLNQRVRIT